MATRPVDPGCSNAPNRGRTPPSQHFVNWGWSLYNSLVLSQDEAGSVLSPWLCPASWDTTHNTPFIHTCACRRTRYCEDSESCTANQRSAGIEIACHGTAGTQHGIFAVAARDKRVGSLSVASLPGIAAAEPASPSAHPLAKYSGYHPDASLRSARSSGDSAIPDWRRQHSYAGSGRDCVDWAGCGCCGSVDAGTTV